MRKNKEESLTEIQSNALSQNLDQTNERKHVEISEEQKRERSFLSGMLLEQKEDLVKAYVERERKRNEEIIELMSGEKTTLKALIAVQRRPYMAEFPNDNLFFPEIFRINFPHLDSKKYRKPKIVGEWIKEIIYDRFAVEVYHTLDTLNPILPGGNRKYKLFQNLNDEGLIELRRFREEAVEIMQTCQEGEWYEFRKKLYDKYRVPYQLKIFEKN